MCIRDSLLLENKCMLIEETVNPRVFRFNLTVKQKDFMHFQKENLFIRLGHFLYKEKIMLELFSLNCKKIEENAILFDVAIRFGDYKIGESVQFIQEDENSKNICEFIGKNIEPFFIEIISDTPKSKKTNYKDLGGKSNFLEKREKLNNPVVVKDRIGEIKNKDGSITIFYKSKENKILKEVIDD